MWGAIAGAVISAGASYLGNKKSSKAAKDAGEAASKADEERLAFDKQRYQDWQDTYGSLEDNLAEYYNKLSPTLRTVQGLEAFEKEKDLAMTGLRENLAQRGLSTSGLSAQVETTTAIESAKERARIRANAPMEVAREKASFLNVGLGQNPGDTLSQSYGERAQDANRTAGITAQISGRTEAGMWESGANLAEELINVFDTKK